MAGVTRAITISWIYIMNNYPPPPPHTHYHQKHKTHCHIDMPAGERGVISDCHYQQHILDYSNNPSMQHVIETLILTLRSLSLMIQIFTYLKLWVAVARNNFKWVKISHICSIWKCWCLNTHFICKNAASSEWNCSHLINWTSAVFSHVAPKWTPFANDYCTEL